MSKSYKEQVEKVRPAAFEKLTYGLAIWMCCRIGDRRLGNQGEELRNDEFSYHYKIVEIILKPKT